MYLFLGVVIGYLKYWDDTIETFNKYPMGSIFFHICLWFVAITSLMKDLGIEYTPNDRRCNDRELSLPISINETTSAPIWRIYRGYGN